MKVMISKIPCYLKVVISNIPCYLKGFFYVESILTVIGGDIVPIEVKSGAAGRLRSLQMTIKED